MWIYMQVEIHTIHVGGICITQDLPRTVDLAVMKHYRWCNLRPTMNCGSGRTSLRLTSSELPYSKKCTTTVGQRGSMFSTTAEQNQNKICTSFNYHDNDMYQFVHFFNGLVVLCDEDSYLVVFPVLGHTSVSPFPCCIISLKRMRENHADYICHICNLN